MCSSDLAVHGLVQVGPVRVSCQVIGEKFERPGVVSVHAEVVRLGVPECPNSPVRRKGVSRRRQKSRQRKLPALGRSVTPQGVLTLSRVEDMPATPL